VPDIPTTNARKIALFTNVEERAVIPLLDVDRIYKDSGDAACEGLDDIVVEEASASTVKTARGPVRVGQRRRARVQPPAARSTWPWSASTSICTDAYKSLNEALNHAGIHTG
jgi:CTP synthase